MDVSERIVTELSEIRKLLRILAADKLYEARMKNEQALLTTEPRKRIYELFDGTRNYKEIADQVGVTSEAVRQLAVAAAAKGLVSLPKKGNNVCPERVEL